MRTRSPRWQTVSLPKQEYARLRRPWEEFLPAERRGIFLSVKRG